MHKFTTRLSAFLIVSMAMTAPALAAPTEVKLVASDGMAGDYFGITNGVSISGDYAIVGAYAADGMVPNAGAAYIFHFDGNGWVEQQKLSASDGHDADKFGTSVSISGDRAIVGAVYGDGSIADSGAVYVYHFDGTSWVEQQKLTNSDGALYGYFGNNVSISGDYAIICEENASRLILTQGVAFVYHFDGTNWVEQQRLTPSVATQGFCLGGVAISGNHAIVGNYLDDVNGSDSGSAYVFYYDGANWTEQQKLLPNDGGFERDWFGYAISISGNYAVIGKPSPGPSTNSSPGSAYVFQYDGTSWSERQKLQAYDAEFGDVFGYSAALSGDNVVVGARYNDSGALTAGAAYLFHYDGTGWVDGEKLLASDRADNDQFGFSVSMSGNQAIVGAACDDDKGLNSGSAYIYTDFSISPVIVDADNDGYDSTEDCKDNDAAINPGAQEVCTDLVDNDCDGLTDAMDSDCPADVDGDGYTATLDCNDNNAAINPGAQEVCTDLVDNDCDGLTDAMDSDCPADVDGDGYTATLDCNDNNAAINPGAQEVCADRVDNDCDGLIDYADANCPADVDGDGYTVSLDCNDNAAAINPGASEVCGDGLDNNCNGLIDSIDPVCAPVCIPTATSEKGKTCKDGIDNDCDGLTDKLDPNCIETTKVGGRRK